MSAVGTLLAATAFSCYYILHTRHRRKKSNRDNKHDNNLPSTIDNLNLPSTTDNSDDTNCNDDVDDNYNFYKQMGLSEDNLPTHIQREYIQRTATKEEGRND